MTQWSSPICRYTPCVNAPTANGTAQSPIVLDEALMETAAQEKRPEKREGAVSLNTKPMGPRCKGNLIRFPPNKNQHTSYPFGIHVERDEPWDYHSVNGLFYLQAKLCREPIVSGGSACEDCHALTVTPLYVGIMNQIQHSVHENSPLIYHGIGGLVGANRRKADQIRQIQMTKLNTSRKLLGKVATLDNHKQWILAIASGRVDRVASLVQAGLKHRAGIRTLIQEYERAAEKLYQPKGYTNEDIMRSIVMLQLSGTRVAEFAHRSMSLPSPTTIRQNTVMPALTVSPSAPTVAEIEENLKSCFMTTSSEEMDSASGSQASTILHQVLMLDELAIEQRIRWDDSSNRFLGTCREHNHQLSLNFTSEKELDILCDAMDNKNVHLASEATVAGIGVLSQIPREYALRPIMFSGTCKRETGSHHVRMIQTVLDAITKVEHTEECHLPHHLHRL